MKISSMRVKSLLAAGLCLAVGAVTAATDAEYHGVKYSTSTTSINPGEWNRNYAEVKAVAIETGTPVFLFWGNNGCSFCEKLEKAMSTSTFVKFMEESGIYYVFAVGGDSTAGKQAGAVKAATKDGSGEFPYIGWFFRDETGRDIIHKGHGRTGAMAGPVKSGALENQLISTIQKWLAGWSPETGGQFFIKSDGEEESVGNRYEAEAGTSSVTVTLKRKPAAAGKATEDVVVITDARGAKKGEQRISWSASETNKTFDVDVSALGTPGEQLKMTLNGDANATATITFVEKENSASNPLWVGEKPVAFGEWTMDFEGAKALAQANGGYTLVGVLGSLWCPDCANTDRNFLDVLDGSGNNRFKAWAVANKVALVSMDVPKFNGQAGGEGPLLSWDKVAAKEPTLLSRKGMTTTLARSTETDSGAEPELLAPVYRSGLGYLSRKGISDAAADAVLKRNWEMISKDVAEGGFHEKTDGNLNRTGVPIFVLLGTDGKVVARFTDFASVSPMKSDIAKWDNYIKRFDEMLEIAKDKAANGVEATEIANNSLSVTGAIELMANGGSAEGRVSAADKVDTFVLKGMTGNSKETVSVKGSDAARVTVSIVKEPGYKKNDRNQLVLDPISYMSGALKDGITLADVELKEAGNYFVVVKAESLVDAGSSSSTFHAFTVRASIGTLEPGESEARATAPVGSNKIDIKLENGELYRITGLAAEGNSDLSKIEGSSALYRYTGRTGKYQLTLAQQGGEVAFQKWNAGSVGFDPQPVTLPAKAKTANGVVVTRKEDVGIDISFRRTGGRAGDVKVKVVLDKAASTFYYDYAIDPEIGSKEVPRFYVNGKLDFMENPVVAECDWADGADLASATGLVSVTIRETETRKIQSFFGDGKVVFKLEIASETEAGATQITEGKFVVNFTENQKPKPGKVAFTGASGDFAKSQTVYARMSDPVAVMLDRVESDENPVWTKIKSSVSTVKMTAGDELTKEWFEANPVRVGWNNHESATRTVVVTNLPAAGKSVKLTLTPETSGFKAQSGKNSLTIVSVADDAPAFKNESESLTLYRYVAVSNHFAVTGTTPGGKLKFSKLSGSIPGGLSVKYDAKTGDMLLVGVPTGAADKKTGVKAYTAFYQVSEVRPVSAKKSTTVAGLTMRLDIVVVDPTVAGTGAGEDAVRNAACKTTRTLTTVPFVDTEDVLPGKRRLAGVLNVTLPATGKASAKYTDESGTYSFSAKSWQEMDEASSNMTVRLACTKKGYTKYYVEAEVAPDGTVDLTLSSGSAEFSQTVPGAKQWSKDRPATAYQGYYTAALCAPEILTAEKFDGYAPRGMGYLTFNLAVDSRITASSAAAKGLVKWAGTLPNGTAVSGSSVLLDRGESAWLPYFYVKSADAVYGIAEIVRGAKANAMREEPCYKAVFVPAEVDPSDESSVLYTVPTFWDHVQTSKTNTLDWVTMYDLRGSYYDATLTALKLDCCCELFHGTTNMDFSVQMPGVSEKFGALGPVASVPVQVSPTSMGITRGTVNPQAVKLSFSKSTGVVSGSFKLPVETGKDQSASFKGVVVVGWGNGGSCSECGEGNKWLPFVSGWWKFSDSVGYEILSKGAYKPQSAKVARGGLMQIESAGHE